MNEPQTLKITYPDNFDTDTYPISPAIKELVESAKLKPITAVLDFSPPVEQYAITITAKAMRKQMRDMARQFNLSRPRAVSLKRPSPQLSRDKLGTMRVIARMNILYEALNER